MDELVGDGFVILGRPVGDGASWSSLIDLAYLALPALPVGAPPVNPADNGESGTQVEDGHRVT